MERGRSMGTEDRALNIQNSKWRSRMLRPQEPELLLWHKDINEALVSMCHLPHFGYFPRSLETYLSLPGVAKVTPDAWMRKAK